MTHDMLLRPTAAEAAAWLLGTVTHVLQIEYYLERLQVGTEDPQRPHDIVGDGSKLSYEVLRGFAIQQRRPLDEKFFERQVLPSLLAHRRQFHHQRWNQPSAIATADNMRLGAIDAICSLLENRGYQGGTHGWDAIAPVIDGNPAHKQPWMRQLLPEMRRIARPEVALEDLRRLPTAVSGIPSVRVDAVRASVADALATLEREHGLVL